MSTEKTFACAINCMDGRVQDAVKNYMQKNYGVDYVDMVTEPGPNKILADALAAVLPSRMSKEDNTEKIIIQNIKKRVEISVHHHGSKVVAIVGHFGCAGNPAEKDIQIEHLRKAGEVVKLFGYQVEIVLLWVNGDWTTVEKID